MLNKFFFCNMQDNKEEFYQILNNHFKQVEVTQVGLVALFKASQAIPS
jgi:hypothetical protein